MSWLTALAGKARRRIGVIPRNKALGPSLRIWGNDKWVPLPWQSTEVSSDAVLMPYHSPVLWKHPLFHCTAHQELHAIYFCMQYYEFSMYQRTSLESGLEDIWCNGPAPVCHACHTPSQQHSARTQLLTTAVYTDAAELWIYSGSHRLLEYPAFYHTSLYI